ncbi:hypothetical protein QTG54_005038 [Skeletonema marinoi]|uniref:F-box domain-containing protein n=1 Tax=Skeletonema marinoi TaxID=267567 RepID=A0AAD8YFI8_9STRA|nr:hypothetical protein QTG54_005038 [Skeletonema marinoi]
MPHPKEKKRRLEKEEDAAVATEENDDNLTSTIDSLGTDVFAHIFGFLPPKDIMRARLNNKMRLAATITIVPVADFCVDSEVKYNGMAAMASALPNLQLISLRRLGCFQIRNIKYNDGEDPDEQRAARTINWPALDIEIILSFRRLHSLKIWNAPLNGRYNFLFNFPLLKKLSIGGSSIAPNVNYLKWDLGMLSGVPLLEVFSCTDEFGGCLTGNINSLRVLKDTLEEVYMHDCHEIQGNFMDLADFPRLKELHLDETAVTGDVREIGEQDFLALETLVLPDGVYGGKGYEFQNISDAADVAKAVYSIKKQRPSLLLEDWYGRLSSHSPDWYDDWFERAPLCIYLVEAGKRVGYRWESENGHSCEVIWLDPEPERESSDYEEYIEQLDHIEKRVYFRGFFEPPTEEEYNMLYCFVRSLSLS